MHNLRPHLDLLNQGLHFKRLSRGMYALSSLRRLSLIAISVLGLRKTFLKDYFFLYKRKNGINSFQDYFHVKMSC